MPLQAVITQNQRARAHVNAEGCIAKELDHCKSQEERERIHLLFYCSGITTSTTHYRLPVRSSLVTSSSALEKQLSALARHYTHRSRAAQQPFSAQPGVVRGFRLRTYRRIHLQSLVKCLDQKVATVRQQSTGSVVGDLAPSCDAVRHKCSEMHSGRCIGWAHPPQSMQLCLEVSFARVGSLQIPRIHLEVSLAR